MLRPYAERQHAARNAPQQRPLQHLHEKWRFRSLAAERRADDVILHENLHALSKASGKFASLLHGTERFVRYRATAQGLGKNIGGSHGVLLRQIDADTAKRPHCVRRVADKKQALAIPTAPAI